MIADDKVAEIRERTDVVALVGEYVALKRVGASFKGLCPFHSEKSASFYVHPARQFFHCFGCGASGDPIKFLMLLDGRSFPEALRILAERAGIEVPAEDAQQDAAARRAKTERDRLLAVAEAAAGFFLRQLVDHPLGRMARDELRKRGVAEDVAATYRLGYAPHGWDGLARHLSEQGHSARDAEAAGLIAPRRSGDGFYDRFRHRLMFPIADVHGRIVAFSGRILDPPPGEEPREGQDPPAKYVNSPEGPLYKKGELLFGLHEARVELRREGIAVVCEGNFDVVATHQAGIRHVVAPLGTAFTSAQAKLLRRYAPKVVLLFDGDRAGRKAVSSAFPLLMAESLTTTVATLPAGEDPDSFVRARGPEALAKLVANAVPIVEHLIESAAAEAGMDPAARAAAIETLGPILATVPSPVEARLWVERVANVFEVRDIEAVRRQLRKGAMQSRERRPRADADAPKPEGPEQSKVPSRSTWSGVDEIEKEAVLACLDHPPLLRSSDAGKLSTLLTSTDLRVILGTAAQLADAREGDVAPALLASVPEGPARTWLEERLSIQTFDEAAAASFLPNAIRHLEKRRIEREIRSLEPLVKQALRDGDAERANELLRQRDALYRQGRAS